MCSCATIARTSRPCARSRSSWSGKASSHGSTKTQIRPGSSWQTALGQQIESIKSAAVFVGESGFGPWQNQEIQALLNQFVKRECPVIPVILPSTKATPELPWTLANLHCVDFRDRFAASEATDLGHHRPKARGTFSCRVFRRTGNHASGG